MEDDKARDIANRCRDVLNLLAVFQEEYNLPEEASNQIKKEIDGIIADL